ncbi:hypothetical protein JHK86_022230 [Glycine max]|nr:hypothetical protein JHK86_022230 [Glycine max]
MEEMSRFRNEVQQAGHKHEKRKTKTKADLHKSDERHKPDKRQPLSKGPRYERYTPLTINHTMILKEAFNLELPIQLPQMKPPRLGGINPVNQDDPVIISIIIANFMVSRVLISIIIENFMVSTKLEVSPNIVHPHTGPLLGFTCERVETKGYMDLMPPSVTTSSPGASPLDINWEIVTIKADQKEARQCYVESLKVASYPLIREPAMPYPTSDKGTQVMTVDEGSQIRALIVY